jgi:hypothetical protein
MNSKKLLLTAFILVALAQLFIPWQMISKQAGIAETGTEFKFKTEFKINRANNRAGSSLGGKYIWLQFAENHIKIADKKEWEENQSAYVLFSMDSAGFAKIKSVTKDKPINSSDWVRARTMIYWKDSTSLQLIYPFNNYYIEDTNPKDIDAIINKELNDSLKINYLKVRIKENQFIIKDLLIDGVPFKEIVRNSKKNH